MAQVAFVKTRDSTQGVPSALALLGQDVFTNKNVLLKPNYNSGHPTPGSTDNQGQGTLISVGPTRSHRAAR